MFSHQTPDKVFEYPQDQVIEAVEEESKHNSNLQILDVQQESEQILQNKTQTPEVLIEENSSGEAIDLNEAS